MVSPVSPLDTAPRRSLLEAKLKGLVRGRWGDVVDRATTGPFLGGASMAADGEAWVLAEDRPERSVGPAVAWAAKRGAATVHLLASAETGALARRAALFARPVLVWRVEGRSLEPVEPEPLAPEPPLDPRAEPFRPLLVTAGAEPVVEHGRLLGEVRGLEVARVVGDEDGVHLEIGVGKYDREVQRLVHGDRPDVMDLFEVVRAVLEHRRPGGEGHDAYHLASERWLRSVVVAHPDLVGAASLQPVSSPVRRDDLRRRAPAPAAGVDLEGRPLLVVCSVGADLDLVPAAADARLADGRDPRLLLCVPEADDYRATRELAATLAEPAEVVTIGDDWRAL
jgi:hypothetical protein